ncbi:DUF2927 domain-containing protein [Actinoplanes hulinensis]|uniref:DUF2927 domain-containing protein n=1 Tax=Actinoplanes hulinensis TaxID=1144547 RepID=A0ABS7B9A1_9ACTN|nr:DUF2927 domain-containing protein [Actinoplanes hulinensis]MBW6437472.1 DUF2927 domain-containing protein [Actinoplanes hulinensis]
MGSAVGNGTPPLLPILLGLCVLLTACDSPGGGAANATASSPAVITPTTSPAASPTPSATPSPAPVKPRISKAGLAHFLAVAFDTEYGDDAGVITMWEKPEVTVRVHGGAAKSRSCVNKVIADFNALSATTDLRLTQSTADIELHFAPVSKFRSIEPKYVSGNDGFLYYHWSDRGVLTDANVMIRSTGISETIRCHLIREELTRAMGMAKDSGKYPNSIFYDEYYPAPTRYSSLDKEVIRLLYSGAVHPGDDKKTIKRMVTVK